MMEVSKESISITYIGEDMGYWKELSDRIAQVLSNSPIRYRTYKLQEINQLHQVFSVIASSRHAAVYVDLSTEPVLMLSLMRLLRQSNTTQKVILTVLFPYNHDVSLFDECSLLGVHFAHIKSSEIYAAAFSACLLAFPERRLRSEYAEVRAKEELTLEDPGRLIYLAKGYFTTEGSFNCKPGQSFDIEIPAMEKFLHTYTQQVLDITKQGLIYETAACYKFKPIFVEPLPPPNPKDLPQARQKKEAEHTARLKDSRERFEQWVEEHATNKQLQARILCIDHEMEIIRNLTDKLVEEFEPLFRFTQYLDEVEEIFLRFYPDFVVFHLENPPPPEPVDKDDKEKQKAPAKPKRYNDNAALKEIIAVIKKMPNYTPFVMVFSGESEFDSTQGQEFFAYQKMLFSINGFNVEHLADILADRLLQGREAEYQKQLEKKLVALRVSDPKKYRDKTIEDLREKTVSFNEDDENGYVYHHITVQIKTLTEVDITINSPEKLSLNHAYLVNDPFAMAVTFVEEIPSKREGDPWFYRGVSHYIGEQEKTKLRQMIIRLFVADKERARQEEAEKFAKMNEAQLQKKKNQS